MNGLTKDELPPGYADIVDISMYLTSECYKLIYSTVDEYELLLSRTNHKEIIINVLTNMMWKLCQAIEKKEEKTRVLNLMIEALTHMKGE